MESRAPAEPYTHEFEATVERGGVEVTLSETYFYPEGGGQPADRGSIAGVPVVDVQKGEDGVVHELAEPLEAGATVECRVDPTFRTYCMRAHTASHALYGAGRRLLDDLGYGGFGIVADTGEDGVRGKVRVDFETTTTIDDGTLVELERLVNQVVWDSRPVTWESVPREAALADAEVAFNTKTEEGVSGVDEVRLVDIEGWDRAACGGTHVRNTREIGPVTVLDRSNPGEGQTRVEFAVGATGIERRATDSRAARTAAATLGTGVESLPEAVDRIRDERERLEEQVTALQERFVEARLAQLATETVEREGRTWLVGSVAGLDANALADQVRTRAGEVADVVALVTPEGSLAVGTTGDVDAGGVVTEVTDAFGGGGGGSPTVAQGGGFDADPAEVVELLKRG